MTREAYNERLVDNQLSLHQNKQKLIIELISTLAHCQTWKDNTGTKLNMRDYLFITFNYKNGLDQFKNDLFTFSLDQLQDIYLKLVIEPNYFI